MMASGDSSGGMDMISGLTPSTTYTIEVAAVNSAGTGVYSDAITELTLGMIHTYTYRDFPSPCVGSD